MKLIQAIVYSLINTNFQKQPPTWLVNDFMSQVLRGVVFMVEPDYAASVRICQFRFVMVGLFLYRKQMSQQFYNNLSEVNVLRRRHNSFWQRGAGLTSLARQKGLFIYSSTTKKQSDWARLVA